jgi:hypothetical protein
MLFTGCSTTSNHMDNACPYPKVIDESGLGIDDHDRSTIYNVIKMDRCSVYYKDLPCVAKFHKLGYHHYYVSCGAPPNRNKSTTSDIGKMK